MNGIDRDAALVLCVDMQERLAAAMDPEAWADVEANAARLLQGASILGLPIVVTEQYPKGLGPSTAAVREAFGEVTPHEKLDFDALADPAVAEAVKASGRRQLLICGMETHICVLQTVQGARAAGYEATVIADAVLSRVPSNRALGLELARAAGAQVSSVETVLFGCLGRAGGAEFKAISKLIR